MHEFSHCTEYHHFSCQYTVLRFSNRMYSSIGLSHMKSHLIEYWLTWQHEEYHFSNKSFHSNSDAFQEFYVIHITCDLCQIFQVPLQNTIILLTATKWSTKWCNDTLILFPLTLYRTAVPMQEMLLITDLTHPIQYHKY